MAVNAIFFHAEGAAVTTHYKSYSFKEKGA